MRILLLLVLVVCSQNALAACGDVNNDGQITVTDGVNVLRAAADLPADLRCSDSPQPTPTPGSGLECQEDHDCLRNGRFFRCRCPEAPLRPSCPLDDGIIVIGRCDDGFCRREQECDDDDCRSVCDSLDCGNGGRCVE